MWRNFFIWFIAVSVQAYSPPLSAQDKIAWSAKEAARQLNEAAAELILAKEKENRVNALTGIIRSFEAALAVMRASLRQISLEKNEMEARLAIEEQKISRLIGVLYSIEKEPAPVKLVHPGGPLATARAGMLLSDILPKLQNPIEKIKSDLSEFENLENLQAKNYAIIENGLKELQSARNELTIAISSRQTLPQSFVEDPSETAILSAASKTIDNLVKGLSKIPVGKVTAPLPDIQKIKGQLLFPVTGRIIREFNEEDSAGIKRPGIIVATSPAALVISPTVATIRYQGQLLDYGLVSILEPSQDILFVFSGLERTFGQIGDILHAGDPLGVMGGTTLTAAKIKREAIKTSSAYRPQTLYFEVRKNHTPQNPLLWFDVKED